ncbi:DUF2946 family protein [Neotabrizicola shimadae]|uniref:DUF2946 family protein n=1 Tax=Neotabrizicola shimadae TaxID=2807096 RepID=A0A8G0ZTH5_9RHOB|nr:DUF2946 family protein [Neotabrizicola shimadae]QYZ68452.1 DUF2946 family protein [Neotabrizicola shimadae]
MTRRLITGWLLALVLALTSVTASVARAQAAGATDVVICSGYGIVTVAVDESGNPTGPVHDCPFCLAAMGAALLPDLPVALRPLSDGMRMDRPGEVAGWVRPSLPPLARGPPGAV